MEDIGDLKAFYETSMATFNNLGIIWTARQDFNRALSYLEKSNEIYVSLSDEVKIQVKAAHLQTMFFMAQVYGFIGDMEKV